MIGITQMLSEVPQSCFRADDHVLRHVDSDAA